MSVPYERIEDLLRRITGPNQAACIKLLNDNLELFQTAHGSVHNHQAWRGGYYDHICEVMNICNVLYYTLNNQRLLPFSISDAFLVLFLHDIEKPWKYQKGEGGVLEIVPELREKPAQHEFRMNKLKEYGIKLTSRHLNALQYVEGEYSNYSSRKRVSNELAGFVHCCDTLSARVWYDRPLRKNDLWQSAQRFRGKSKQPFFG